MKFFFCAEIPKENTEEMAKQLIKTKNKAMPKGVGYILEEFSCP